MAASAEGFRELATLDCTGSFNLFAQHDLIKTKLKTPLKGLVDFALKSILERGQCYCSSMTENDFDRTFLIGSFLNQLGGPSKMTGTFPCANSDWANKMWKDGIVNSSRLEFFLPAGCDLASWQSGSACQLKQDLGSYGVTLVAALKRCPSSWFPYVSFGCNGAGCDKILMPCNSASECGTLPCQPLSTVCSYTNKSECPPEIIYNFTVTNMYDAVSNMSLYDHGDTFPGCLPANSFFEDIISRVRSQWRQTPSSYQFQMNGLYTIRLCMDTSDDFIFKNTNQSTAEKNQFKIETMGVTCTVGLSDDNANYTAVTCTTIKVWDGLYDSGRPAATASNRIDGSYFNEIALSTPQPTEQSAQLLASHTCSNEFHFFPVNPRIEFAGAAPWLNDHINWFFTEIFGMQRCRAQARFTDLSWENFRIRFFDLLGAFYNFIIPAPTPIAGISIPTMSDWRVNTTFKVGLPSTCTFDSWKNTGLCALQWTGLQSLLGVGVTIRAYAKDCGAFKLPEFKLECIGTGCSLFTSPQLCTTSTECVTGSICMDVYDQFYNKLGNNSTNRDIWQAFYKLNMSAPDNCGTETNGRKVVRKFIQYLAGQTPDNQDGTKICMVDFENRFKDFNFTQWGQAQATVEGDLISLISLTPWSPAGVSANPAAPNTVTISFNVAGDASKVEDVIKGQYPTATVSTTAANGATTVTVTLTGSTAESSAQILASDVKNPNSNLNQDLVKAGANPDESSIALTTDPAAAVGPDTASSSVVSLSVLLVAAASALLFLLA